MSKRERNFKAVTANKDEAISILSDHLDSMIQSECSSDLKRADLISFWIKTYVRFMTNEATFDPTRYIGYSRGDIVKVDFGYRIGNEQGGLHYAVVIDNNNSKRSGTLTVIPLSSVKNGKQIHSSSVAIGKEIFTSIVSKHDKLHIELEARIKESEDKIASLNYNDAVCIQEKLNELKSDVEVLRKKERELSKLKNEILKMKRGSIALVSQITTVSKIRVYDPIYAHNVLYGIRLSPTTLDKINQKIKELFVHI